MRKPVFTALLLPIAAFGAYTSFCGAFSLTGDKTLAFVLTLIDTGILLCTYLWDWEASFLGTCVFSAILFSALGLNFGTILLKNFQNFAGMSSELEEAKAWVAFALTLMLSLSIVLLSRLLFLRDTVRAQETPESDESQKGEVAEPEKDVE